MRRDGHSINSTCVNSINLNCSDIDPFPMYCSNMPEGRIAWCIFAVPCMFVGVPAGVWVLWVLALKKSRGVINDTYMFNLTIIDLLFNVTLLPCIIDYLWHRTSRHLIAGKFFILFNFIGRPLLNVCICVDCYIAVVLPITYMRIKNKPYKTLVCVLVWAFTLSYTTVVIFLGFRFKILILYPLFLTTIAFCDISILHALKKPDVSGKMTIHPQKKRALQIIINSLIMLFVSYLPTLLIQILSLMLPIQEQDLVCKVLIPSYISPCLGSTFMPLLYLQTLRMNKKKYDNPM